MGTLITADALRAAAKTRKTTDVPLSIGDARLRALSAGASLALRKKIAEIQAADGDTDEILPGLIADSWIDESGELIAAGEEGRAVVLDSLDGDDFKELARAALKLNGLLDEQKPEEAVKEAVGNSEAIRTGS